MPFKRWYIIITITTIIIIIASFLVTLYVPVNFESEYFPCTKLTDPVSWLLFWQIVNTHQDSTVQVHYKII